MACPQVRRLTSSANVQASAATRRICVHSRWFTRVNGIIRRTSTNNGRKIDYVLYRFYEESIRGSSARIIRRR